MSAKDFNDMYEEFMFKLMKVMPDENGFYTMRDVFNMVRKLNNTLPAIWWINMIHPFSKQIFEKDETFFLENQKFDNILKEKCTGDMAGIEAFNRTWKLFGNKTHESIWTYFQNLLILSYEYAGIRVSFDAELLKRVYNSGPEYLPNKYSQIGHGYKGEPIIDILKKRFISKKTTAVL